MDCRSGEGCRGMISGTFQRCGSETARIWRNREMHVEGKGSPKENTEKLSVCTNNSSPVLLLQSPPPPPIAPLRTTTSLFFITCVFPSPILPVLSAVSKIDLGLLCILVHVGMVARVRSLSICLGCQGVSWVPACLLLNIYHLFNAAAPPESWTLLLIPPTRFLSLSTHLSVVALAFSCFFLFSLWCSACSIFWYTLSVSYFVSRLPYLNPAHTCASTRAHPRLPLPFCFNQPRTSRLKLLHHKHLRLFPNLSAFKSYTSSFRIIMRPLLERSVENKRDIEGEGVPIPGRRKKRVGRSETW